MGTSAVLLLWALVIWFPIGLVGSINWIGLPTHWESHRWNWTSTNWTSSPTAAKNSCWAAVRRGLLTKEQGKLCTGHSAVMHAVWEAARSASAACQQAFAERRWNCTSLNFLPRITPDLSRGTREQAWVYALASASLTRSLARGCSSGWLHPSCSCGSFPRHPPDGQFKWGGCGDDIKYGKKLAKGFTDATLKRIGRLPASSLLRIAESESKFLGQTGTKKNHWKHPHIMAAVNIHNNRVGRKVAEQSLQTQCKCHGVSGSCQIKTCWRSLPSIGEMAERMKRLYGMAVEVVPRKPSDLMRRSAPTTSSKAKLMAVHYHPLAPPSLMASSAGRDGGFGEHDLIYITKSPDYCRADRKVTGSLGTVGRTCSANASSVAQSGGCASLCCGRGYRTTFRDHMERCHCKYIWCCEVRCQICRSVVEVHTCL